jgi:TRAP-type C4-dicarboxylate transport system permease small subunit
MALILIGNVISRSIFNRSWTFAEESGQFLVIAITFIGISYAARQARHISMSAIFDLIPTQLKKVFIIIISAVTAIAMFYLAYLSFKYMLSVYELGRVTPALGVPMYLVILFIPLGFIFGGIQYARNLVINLKEKEVYLSYDKKLEYVHSEAEPNVTVLPENEEGRKVKCY